MLVRQFWRRRSFILWRTGFGQPSRPIFAWSRLDIRSKGRIPEIFLRGVGLPDEWITYIPSLVGDGIQFFSCFISYSSLDKPFALWLHEALQSKGIKCCLDEKQLLPGDDILRQLERGIHLWDKFLLCASKNSLTSWWVEDEIKTTLEKERALRK